MTAENGGQHYTKQIEEIPLALNVKPAARLDFLRKRTGSFHILADEDVLIVEIEHDQHRAQSRGPYR